MTKTLIKLTMLKLDWIHELFFIRNGTRLPLFDEVALLHCLECWFYRQRCTSVKFRNEINICGKNNKHSYFINNADLRAGLHWYSYMVFRNAIFMSSKAVIIKSSFLKLEWLLKGMLECMVLVTKNPYLWNW